MIGQMANGDAALAEPARRGSFIPVRASKGRWDMEMSCRFVVLDDLATAQAWLPY